MNQHRNISKKKSVLDLAIVSYADFGDDMKIICCISLMVVMLRFPNETGQVSRQALMMWSEDIVPFLLPYMILTRMLGEQFVKTRLPMAFTASVLGLAGGSPSGSMIISSYTAEQNMPARKLFSLCALTGTMSPAFILNTAGKWFSIKNAGIILLSSHAGGALISALLIYGFTPSVRQTDNKHAPSKKQEKTHPIHASISSILAVGGCIVFYSVLATGIHLLLPNIPDSIQACLHAFLEASGGLKDLSMLYSVTPRERLILASAFLGFSGMSILNQNLLFLSQAGISIYTLSLFGIIRGLISALITVFLSATLS